ncbi:nuclear transport factor 2 family protein [Croceicoccus bisphenolivorans]|uniref:nuclear transport factor 2 family protein n=1 Tax=Croceicoccus bisphenolivorans TaxID=1783232 RepID=UPI000A5AB7C0|nr:hypothetical protein [Croceicoccus bisphenolivorans]
MDLERNKALVARLFDDVLYGDGSSIDDLDAIVAEDYIQHNPKAGQGLAGVKAWFHEIVPRPPGFGKERILATNYFAEGDLVVRQEISKIGLLIDVFRVEGGMLVEHWDAFRPVPGGVRLPGF